MSENSDEIEKYGDPWIDSADAKVPVWLLASYIVLPIWGILTFYFFWNGSLPGVMVNGPWHKLQEAANTTFPFHNENESN